MTEQEARWELLRRLAYVEAVVVVTGGISEHIREARAARIVLHLTADDEHRVVIERERVVQKLQRRRERVQQEASPPVPIVQATDAELLRAAEGALRDIVAAGDRARGVLARIEKERAS